MRALQQSKHCMVKDGALLGLPVISQLLEHLFLPMVGVDKQSLAHVHSKTDCELKPVELSSS